MIKYFYFLTLISICVRSDVVQVDQCDSGIKPTTVEISGCSSQPCPLVKGTNVELVLNFTAPLYMDLFEAQVKAKVSIITITFPLPDPNGCNGLKNTRCPLELGEPASYKLAMPVSENYPSITNLLLTFSLLDSNSKEVFSCFKVTTYVTTNNLKEKALIL